MPTTKNLGVVSMVPSDDWSSTVNFQKANFVRHNKATYMAKAANRNIEPGVSSNWQQYWMLCNYDGVAAAPTAIPLPDAETGAIGDSNSYAAANHVHPMSIVYESAQDALNKAVKTPILTGSAISAENTLANAVVPFKAQSKNLIPFPYYDGGAGAVVTNNGLTYTVNADGTIAVAGTATGVAMFYLTAHISSGISGNMGLKGGQTYWLNKRDVVVYKTSQDGESQYFYGSDEGSTFVWKDNYILISVRLQYAIGTVVDETISPIIAVTENGEIPYTPYVADGTEATVTACGKNLFNAQGEVERRNPSYTNPFTFGIGSISTNKLGSGSMTYVMFAQKYPAGVYSFSATYETVSEVADDEHVSIMISIPAEGFTFNEFYNAYSMANYSDLPSILINASEPFTLGLIFRNTDVIEQENAASYSDIMLVRGDISEYEPYSGQVYSTEVGESVDITQQDKYTNVFSGTDGVAVSGEFILSTQYELDDKLTPLFGTFANRPTTTQPYTIMYIATDQTGDNKVTILPANADGSVSGNWITI